MGIIRKIPFHAHSRVFFISTLLSDFRDYSSWRRTDSNTECHGEIAIINREDTGKAEMDTESLVGRTSLPTRVAIEYVKEPVR